MNFKHCKDCPHRSYDGHTDRCRLLFADVMTGKRKACSQVRSEECRTAKQHYEEGAYTSAVDDAEALKAAESIIAKAQARYAAERKAKEEKKTCGTCKHYPVNPIRNPARMEACGIYKIAVREGGKACPEWEART